jgi:hypothetical protein
MTGLYALCGDEVNKSLGNLAVAADVLRKFALILRISDELGRHRKDLASPPIKAFKKRVFYYSP